MLKKICGLFLGLVVCMGSACVTPTHASSAQNIIITHIQASGELGAKDEYVVLHNNSGVEADVTNWCITNKSAVLFACFTPTVNVGSNEHFIVPGYSDAVIVSSEHASSSGNSPEAYSLIYTVTNQSSGSIVNASDTLSVINQQGEVIDTKAWESPIPASKALARIRVLAGPDIYATSNSLADWVSEERTLPPFSAVEIRISVDEDTEIPENSDDPTTPPIITELLANAGGSDIGNEFIELYNPNENSEVLLDEYVLLVGIDTVEVFKFPPHVSIPPHGYISFSNLEIDFTLVNTNGRVQLGQNTLPTNGSIDAITMHPIGEPVTYSSPKDDYAWAFIDGVWQYTKYPTPGSANGVADAQMDVSMTGPELLNEANVPAKKPCATNQFRNPVTGRCKLLAGATSTPTPCKIGQVRNAETNRCRNITSGGTAPTPCKEGQERNPETKRCRAIVKMSQAGFGVLGVQTKASAAVSWYYWAAIGAILLLVVGYAVWEWRQELATVGARIRMTFAKRPH